MMGWWVEGFFENRVLRKILDRTDNRRKEETA
jgi:hypothetical protein